MVKKLQCAEVLSFSALPCSYVNVHLINTVGVYDRLGCVECRCPESVASLEAEQSSVTRGGVLCCRDCPSRAPPDQVLDYALRFTTVYR